MQLINDNATLHSDPEFVTPWCIESHARDVYTHTIFAIFQDEVKAARDKCDIQSMFQVGDERTTMIRDGSGGLKWLLEMAPAIKKLYSETWSKLCMLPNRVKRT